MSAPNATWRIAGRSVSVTNLDKLYWPEDGVSKGDMLRYYRSIAPALLPHLQGRPVTLRVYPDGTQGFSYYRREMPENAPAWLHSAPYRPRTPAPAIQIPVIDDAASLIWLANQGCVEFHPWLSRLPDLAQPDQAVFDLDPGDEATFADVLRAALRLRETLEALGLHGYAKTSGGRGLHVYLPLAPGQTFAAVRAWVKALAQRLATTSPDLIAVARGATHLGRLVTIDYAQNSIGRNTAAPYTLRARPHAPVSAPLSWEEVEAGHLRPADLTLRTVPDRVSRLGDLFAPALGGGQRLPRLSE
ncbi:MAG TPA: non-homologous end-joining DNA ligase [Ktedonobacterales bacterium]|nr:non-homologous end-joining DNA ligase [Ktedonobacterales bacterium]